MIGLNMPFIMARCLFLTIIVECVIGFATGIRNKKDFLNIVLVNFVTNPVVVTIPVFFNLKYGIFERRICLLILEIIAVLFEGFVYKKFLLFRKINPFLLSLILNVSSFITGEIINYYIY